jgi:hypothetical protein
VIFNEECGFFNKTLKRPCPHKSIGVITRPDGHETDACNGHAASFFLNASRKNPLALFENTFTRRTVK